MDYIYEYLCRRLAPDRKAEVDYTATQELIYLYLTRIVTADCWWHLRCQGNDELIEEIYAARDASAQLRALRRVSSSVARNQAQLNSYTTMLTEYENLLNNLLENLNEFRTQRNLGTHHDRLRLAGTGLERVERCDNILLRIRDSVLMNPSFPAGILPDWRPLVPIGRRNGQVICMWYNQMNMNLLNTAGYGWQEIQLPECTPEFQRNGLRSATHLQEGRLYFYKPAQEGIMGAMPEIGCAYPFVQVKMSDNCREFSYIWLFDSICTRQNGSCQGTDIFGTDFSDKQDVAYIPELAVDTQDSNNPYLMKAEYKYGNAFPIRNVYRTNYAQWNDNVSAKAAIEKVVEHLKQSVPLVYLYGEGGIGKTAAIQHLLEAYYYKPQSNPIYDYLIFLSAKKKEWDDQQGIRVIDYEDGHQSFADLRSLRIALRNILAPEETELSSSVETDANWYEGKSILLVLDDFETVEEKERNEILKYLNRPYASSRRPRKRHQAIITCRATPSEGYAANVQLAPLNEADTAAFANFCAQRMEGGREDNYLRILGNHVQDCDLTRSQKEKREIFRYITKGLPLLIRVHVYSDKDCSFIKKSTKTNKEVLNYLFENTYQQLSSAPMKKLAHIAALLTQQKGQNSIQRLQFVWDYEEFEQNHDIDDMLDRMYRYGILAADSAGKHFSFTEDYMREYIEMGAKEDRHLPHQSEKLAEWLSGNINLSISECLLRRLKITVYSWYCLRNESDYYLDNLHGKAWTAQVDSLDPTELLDDAIVLYKAIHLADNNRRSHFARSAMQMVTQVYCDDPAAARKLYTEILTPFLESMKRPDVATKKYDMEYLRWSIAFQGKGRYETVLELLLNNLRKLSDQQEGDNKDTLLIYWNTMLLLRDMHRCRIPFADDVTSLWERGTVGLTGMFHGIGKRDYLIFAMEMEQVIKILPNRTTEQKKAINNLKARCSDVKNAAERAQTRRVPELFFGGGRYS